MPAWIDFKALRAQLDFEQVLRHYRVEVKRKGNQHHGFCPLPNHNGKKNSPSFSANLERGIFHCFGCGAEGNAIDFAVHMQGWNPDDGGDVRKAAVLLQEKFNLQEAERPKPQRKRHPRQREWVQPEAEQAELSGMAPKAPERRAVINAPLDFELKRLDPDHPYLDKRGFTKEIIARFGLGFCGSGFLAGRIAIPLHNHDGKLVGYAGRTVDNSKIGEGHPRYLFPSKRERGGITHEFHKMLLLYNSHRIKAPVEDLVVVEGFPSVWWLSQMGFPDTVALMGWAMSDEQAAIVTRLVPPSGRVWVVPDGNEAGERCAASVFAHLAPHRFMKWVKLEPEKQPTDYPGAFFREQFR